MLGSDFPLFDLAMEKPSVPDFSAMESWLLIVIMQICFQQLVRRMGVVMSPVDFMQQRSDGPCLFGTHHEFDDQPSPWRATGEASGVSVGRRSSAAAGASSGLQVVEIQMLLMDPWSLTIRLRIGKRIQNLSSNQSQKNDHGRGVVSTNLT